MNGLFDAALEIQRFLEERRWDFTIIGGLAVLRWGQPQATQDVDVSLLTGFGGEQEYIEPILRHFAARIPDAGRFALENRALLVNASNGVAIDVVLAGIPFEEELVARSSYYAFLPGVSLRTCTAEDLVILKAFAGRDKDWASIRGILSRQSGNIDWAHIEKHLMPLLEIKGEPEIMERLLMIRRQLP